jgi:glycosyltransferase involved in cell wall biosynthesis
MNNTVIFYAPVGNLIKGFKNGGAEAGCRKTIEILQKAGYKIILIEKPARNSTSKVDGFLFIFKLLAVWYELIKAILKNQKSTLHLAGFYLNQIYFEWVIIRTAKFLGITTVYEIRNGGMIEAFKEGHTIYKIFFKSTMLNSSLVFCQGYDYVEFLKARFNKSSVYYPNYIMDNFISDNNYSRDGKPVINLIYFGRVVPDKNVEFIIDVCHHLEAINLSFHLDIIGAYEDSYYALLSEKIKLYNLENSIEFHGRMEFDTICQYLKSSHFFVFPSKEKREGHSNSLTEAMGCGVVPIVSKAGFNESIVGDKFLVLDQFNPLSYAQIISNIWSKKDWKRYSSEVYNRTISNYTESIVKSSFLNAYSSL